MAGLLEERYRLEAILGEGGMGRVYRAYDRLSGRRVALKLVPRADDDWNSGSGGLGTTDTLAFSLDPLGAAQERPSTVHIVVGSLKTTSSALWGRHALAQEFRTLAALRHPHIISVLDYGFSPQGQPFFTMELLADAPTLRVASYGLPFAEKSRLIVQLLMALCYLHRHGVLHRDLKPSNVLVIQGSEGPQVKLLDFGLALARAQAHRGSFELLGTITYMAPELFQGMLASEAADLFAVGVIAYELLSGQHPFDRGDDDELIQSVIGKEPDWEPLRGHPQLVSLLRRLLAKSPAMRPCAVDALLGLAAATGIRVPSETAALRESTLQTARFVGREEPWTELRQALQGAHGGSGGVWLLAGESGVGKSRLMDELRVYALVRGTLVARGQAVGEGGSAYGVWREVLRTLCLHTPLDELQASVLKLVVSDLGELLERPLADAPALNAQAAQMRLVHAIEALLLHQSEPLLLLLEDLHWADAESLALLRRMAPAARTRKLLIVASYRDDERPDLPLLLADCQLLKLARLSSTSLMALAESMLGPGRCPPELAAFLLRETEGNVFFVIEVMRALAQEAGQLSLVGTQPLPKSVLTGGIQAIVQRRLARLPSGARPLLHLAAVSGRQLDLTILRCFESQLEPWLYVAADAAVLEASEQSWRFAHDKIRESLLLELEPAEKARLHLALAQAIEKSYPGSASHAAVLAEHYESGGDSARAAFSLIEAGVAALSQGAAEQAAAWFEQALSSAGFPRLPRLQAARALNCLVQAQLALGRSAACVGTYERLLAHAGVSPADADLNNKALARLVLGRLLRATSRPALGESAALPVLRELAPATRWVVEAYIWAGHPAKSVLASLLGVELSATLADQGLQAFFTTTLAYTAGLIPLRRVSTWLLRRGGGLAKGLLNPQAELDFERVASAILLNAASWQAAKGVLDRVIAQATRLRDEYSLMFALSLHAMIAFRLGEEANFHLYGAELYERARRTQSLQWLRVYPLYQGILALRRKDYSAAHRLLVEASGYVLLSGDHHGRIIVGGHLARCELGLGNRRVALGHAKTALDLASAVRPTFEPVGKGLAAVAETYLELWTDGDSTAQAELATPLRQALFVLRTCALIFPVLRPEVLLWHGRHAWNQGAPWLARELAEASRRSARRLALPFDESLASDWRARFDRAPQDGNP